MAPLEPWEKVLVDTEAFPQTGHGEIACVDCHGGINSSEDKEEAHTDLVARPSGGDAPVCIECREEQAIAHSGSLHATQEGYWTVLTARGADPDHPAMQEMFGNHCASSHVAVSETSGKPFFTTADTYFTFLIGRNARRNADRPYEYVPVRHVPADPDSFAYYGENLLPDFDAQPTWRNAAPHNIQRQTPQTENCNNCHGNPDMFLTAGKVKPEELVANSAVIIEEIPEVQEE